MEKSAPAESDVLLHESPKVTAVLILSVLGAVMGSLQFGYNTGVINAPEMVIKDFMNQTTLNRTGEPMDAAAQTSLYALIVAIFAVGGTIGGLLAGWWADFFGRKNGFLLNAGVGIVAGLLMYFSKLAGAFEMIIVGRLLMGFSCGLYTGLTPIYLSEISTPDMRGALGVLHQLGVTSGIFLSQILGFPELLGQKMFWDILLGMAVVPCLLQMLIIPFCPDSPRYLLLSRRLKENAKTALQRLRGIANVDKEIEEIKAEDIAQDNETKMSILQLFRNRILWMPLLISVMMHLSQQLSGIVAIFYYSSGLYEGAGLSNTDATHATSGVGAVMVLMTIITIPLMDRIGRRTLHLVGLGGMFVFSILITITLSLRMVVDWFKILSIVVSLLYVASFAVGPGSIPWLIVSELFVQSPRPAAMSVSVIVNWVANFGVGFLFPYMQRGLKDFSFIPFTVLLAGFWIFTFFFVPETKNKTIEEISSQWRKGKIGKSSSNGAKDGNVLVSYKKRENDL